MKKILFLSCVLPLHATSALAEAPRFSSQQDDAMYSIVAMTNDSSGRTVITKRVGISGTSYAKRVLNCNEQTVRLLGQGKTLQDLFTAEPDAESIPIFTGSLAESIARVACTTQTADPAALALQDAATSTTSNTYP
ncbi:hypothetical protein D3C76_446160 [compost metagenome]